METIAAIATAQSPSAIGIVRLSGEETRRVLAALFKDGKFLTQSIQTDKKFLKLAGIQVEQRSDTK